MNPFKVLGKPITHASTTWYEKYQPTKLGDVVGNEHAIKNLEGYLINNNIPHLLLTGPNGSGKATAIKCLVNNYFSAITSPVMRKEAYLEINGAIDRSKDVVSEKNDHGKKSDKLAGMPNIISFIKKRVNLPQGLCKLIIIYDFDHMTSEAQMALRRIMEKYESTRFILQCNDGSVIEAIQSRCTPLRFSRLSDEEVEIVLKRISEKEKLYLPNKLSNNSTNNTNSISDDILSLPEHNKSLKTKNEEILKEEESVDIKENIRREIDAVIKLICLSANGDLKKGIGYLQVIGNSSERSVNAYYKIFNIPSLQNINKYINSCIIKNLAVANDVLSDLLHNGYNADDILDILLKVVIRREDLIYQTFFIQAISEIVIMTENSTSNTHLYALTSKLVNISMVGKYELDLI